MSRRPGRSIVLLVLFLSCSCVVAPPRPTHVQYPVVAAFADRDEVLEGTVDNNLATGTAYVEVVGEKSGLHCRGQGHLTNLAAAGLSCAGQQGDCALTCDDGSSLTCSYKLESCDSGYGAGLDQNTLGSPSGLAPTLSMRGPSYLPSVYSTQRPRSPKLLPRPQLKTPESNRRSPWVRDFLSRQTASSLQRTM